MFPLWKQTDTLLPRAHAALISSSDFVVTPAVGSLPSRSLNSPCSSSSRPVMLDEVIEVGGSSVLVHIDVMWNEAASNALSEAKTVNVVDLLLRGLLVFV